MGSAGAQARLTHLPRALSGVLLAGALASAGCGHGVVLREPAQARVDGRFVTVASGDTLAALARRFATTPEVLARENALEDPARLVPGRTLWVPGRAATAHAPAPSPSAAPAPGPSPAPPGPRATSGLSRLLWPVHGVLISRFGPRGREQHEGIDLAAPEGTPVVAAGAGVVVFAGEQRGYGQLVLIAHAGDLVTVYAHNQENLVVRGEHVERGQLVARVGHSGNASGPHVHFEVRSAAKASDPLSFLR